MLTYDLLFENFGKLHTTPLGLDRITKNIGNISLDVLLLDLQFNIRKIYSHKSDKSDESNLKDSKNIYVITDKYIYTINRYSFTIITVKCNNLLGNKEN